MQGSQNQAHHERLRQPAQRILQHQLADPHESHGCHRNYFVKQAGYQRVGQHQGYQEKTGAGGRDDAVTGIDVGVLRIHALGCKIIIAGHLDGRCQHIRVNRSVISLGEVVEIQSLSLGGFLRFPGKIPHIDGADELGRKTFSSGYLAGHLCHVHGGFIIQSAVGKAELNHAETDDEERQHRAQADNGVAL